MHGRVPDREHVQEDRLGLGQGDGVPADTGQAEGHIQDDETAPGGDITIIKGRKIRAGQAEGKALAFQTPLSFLGGVDTATGRIIDPECDCKGSSVAGSVLCFPYGKGSTVGSYSMYQLKVNGLAPCAIVNSSAEPIVATGAIMSGIPMIDGIDVSLIRTCDDVC